MFVILPDGLQFLKYLNMFNSIRFSKQQHLCTI